MMSVAELSLFSSATGGGSREGIAASFMYVPLRLVSLARAPAPGMTAPVCSLPEACHCACRLLSGRGRWPSVGGVVMVWVDRSRVPLGIGRRDAELISRAYLTGVCPVARE